MTVSPVMNSSQTARISGCRVIRLRHQRNRALGDSASSNFVVPTDLSAFTDESHCAAFIELFARLHEEDLDLSITQ